MKIYSGQTTLNMTFSVSDTTPQFTIRIGGTKYDI
jgi:hypothetical protein